MPVWHQPGGGGRNQRPKRSGSGRWWQERRGTGANWHRSHRLPASILRVASWTVEGAQPRRATGTVLSAGARLSMATRIRASGDEAVSAVEEALRGGFAAGDAEPGAEGPAPETGTTPGRGRGDVPARTAEQRRQVADEGRAQRRVPARAGDTGVSRAEAQREQARRYAERPELLGAEPLSEEERAASQQSSPNPSRPGRPVRRGRTALPPMTIAEMRLSATAAPGRRSRSSRRQFRSSGRSASLPLASPPMARACSPLAARPSKARRTSSRCFFFSYSRS